MRRYLILVYPTLLLLTVVGVVLPRDWAAMPPVVKNSLILSMVALVWTMARAYRFTTSPGVDARGWRLAHQLTYSASAILFLMLVGLDWVLKHPVLGGVAAKSH